MHVLGIELRSWKRRWSALLCWAISPAHHSSENIDWKGGDVWPLWNVCFVKKAGLVTGSVISLECHCDLQKRACVKRDFSQFTEEWIQNPHGFYVILHTICYRTQILQCLPGPTVSCMRCDTFTREATRVNWGLERQGSRWQICGDPAGCVQSKQEEEQHQTNLRSPCLPYGLLSWLVSALNLSCHPKEAADRSLPCLK